MFNVPSLLAGPNGQVEKAAQQPAMCAREGHGGVTDGQDSTPAAAPPARAMAESTKLRILALNMCWPRFPTASVPQRTQGSHRVPLSCNCELMVARRGRAGAFCPRG